MKAWADCKNILCIRPDNMGDVIMTYPAIRTLKAVLKCKITLLTSVMGSHITPCLPAIDEVMVYTFPWVKTEESMEAEDCLGLVNEIRQRNFDAAIIFTAYSQSALPSAMLAFLAGIPRRLAYCRENPYQLLTNWVPDKEPYSYFLHQVQRDLRLVEEIGASTDNDELEISVSEAAKENALRKLAAKGIHASTPWIVVHTGVSELKREYPFENWAQLIRHLSLTWQLPVLLTGAASEKERALRLQEEADNVYAVAGELSVEEFAAVIGEASLVITVNTAAAHIAAATHTPVVVLYALTNPQHTPWKTHARVLPFSVQGQLQSKNEVIRYVNNQLYNRHVPVPSPETVMQAATALMANCYGTNNNNEMETTKNYYR